MTFLSRIGRKNRTGKGLHLRKPCSFGENLCSTTPPHLEWEVLNLAVQHIKPIVAGFVEES